MLLAWVTIVLPLIMAAVPFFAPAPEAGKSFPAKWRAVILVLGVAAALCALLQMRADNRTTWIRRENAPSGLKRLQGGGPGDYRFRLSIVGEGLSLSTGRFCGRVSSPGMRNSL